MKKFYLIQTLLLLVTCAVFSQANFSTFGSGDWSSIGTWNVVSGTDADNIPDANDNVTILNGHVVTVSGGNQQVNNLTLQSTTATALNVNGSTLSLFGTLTGPSSNFQNEILKTDGTGLIKFEGGTRTIIQTWSYGSTATAWQWRLEVAMNPGATGTAASGIRASYVRVSSGTFDCSELRIDSSFSNGTGVIIIDAGATIDFSLAIGTRTTRTTPSWCRSITVNGTLIASSQAYIGGENIFINGRLRLLNNVPTISYPNGTGMPEFTYGSGSALEYARTNIDQSMGDEVNRSTLPNPVVDTIVINTGTSTLERDVILSGDTVFANHVRFGPYGQWVINSGRIVLSANPMITNADLTKFIATIGGDVVIKGVGATPVTLPIGPTETEYNPVTITNNGAADDFTVRALSTRPPCLGPYPLTSVNYQWDISETVAGGSDVTLTLGYTDITKRGSMYNPASGVIVRCSGSDVSRSSGTGETGSGPYFVTGSGFTQFSLFGITSDAVILPLTLMQKFNAQVANNNVALNWSVSCVGDRVTMDLQRSTGNADNFSSIYSITADKARCGEPFEYIDAFAAGNNNYYRIKITDIDGTVTYSSILHVTGVISKLNISVNPNPVFDRATIFIASDKATRLQTFLSDASGRVLREQFFTVASGSNLLNMEVSNLRPGLYLLNIRENGTLIKTIKLMKE